MGLTRTIRSVLGLSLLVGGTLAAAQQTLSVSVVAGAMRDTMEPLAAAFEEANPGITVNLVPEPEGGSFEALIAAGNQPDLLITSFGGQIGRLASQDVVAPLEDFEGAEDLLGRLEPSAVEELYGHTYYIPIGADVTMMIYNRDLFEAAGLDPDSPPETWQEFLDAAAAISDLPDQGNGEVYGTVLWNDVLATGGWYWNMLQPMYLNANQNECGLLNRLGTSVAFDDPECALAEFYAFNREAQQYAPPTMEPGFFSRRIGMWPQYGYSWEPNLREAAGEPMVIGEDVGVAPVPVPEADDTNYSTYGGRALVIMRTTPEREALAWNFIQFLMEDENNLTFIKKLGYLPVLSSLKDDPYFQEPGRAPFVAALENAVLPEMTANAETVANAVETAYQQVAVAGELSPEEGVETAVTQANAALEGQ
jgi:multiple sugar transport system substrate-binding protein